MLTRVRNICQLLARTGHPNHPLRRNDSFPNHGSQASASEDDIATGGTAKEDPEDTPSAGKTRLRQLAGAIPPALDLDLRFHRRLEFLAA
jgi:hypothetical protein